MPGPESRDQLSGRCTAFCPMGRGDAARSYCVRHLEVQRYNAIRGVIDGGGSQRQASVGRVQAAQATGGKRSRPMLSSAMSNMSSRIRETGSRCSRRRYNYARFPSSSPQPSLIRHPQPQHNESTQQATLNQATPSTTARMNIFTPLSLYTPGAKGAVERAAEAETLPVPCTLRCLSCLQGGCSCLR